MERTRLEWAQWMASKGINVFAVSPNSKRPLEGLSWYLRQSTEPETIAQFFSMTSDCNYGLHLGAEYVVIDLDLKPQHNGVRAFEDICRENGVDDFTIELNTLMARTPGGGYHLYFRSPFPCANKNSFPDGIDVRGVSGYVVGPGSADSRGEWKLIDPSVDIAPLPEWLEDYVFLQGYKDPNRDKPVVDLDLQENIDHALMWLRDRAPATGGANGNDWTYETIQYLRDFGLSEAASLKVLNADWNQRCAPPWDLELLEATVANAFEYGQNRPGCKSPTWKAQRIFMGHGQGLWKEMLTPEALAEMFHPTSHLRVVVDNTKPNNDDDVPGDVVDDERDPVTGEDRGDFPWAGFNECMNIPTVRDYVVQRWLLDHSITHMIAKRGTGKSTLALNMACCIATDTPWAGQKIMPGWKVVYICGEDIVGMRLNQRAWCRYYDIEVSDDRFLVAMDVISLTDDARLNMRIHDMMKWADGSRVAVFLDTWQRATSGWSKNDQESMEKAIERAERIAKHMRGPLISLVHPPKDGRMTVTGAGSQEDTSAGIYHVEERDDMRVRLKIDRIKGPGKNKYMDFDLKTLEMEETDAFGEKLTGVVAVKIGGSEDQNTIEAANLVEQELTAWGNAIRGCVRFSLESNEYELGSSVDIKNVAEFISTLAEHALENSADVDRMDALSFKTRYLEGLMPFFKKGLESMSYGMLDKRMKELFSKNIPPTAVCDNGAQVMSFVKKNEKTNVKNPQRKFVFKERQNIE